MFHDQIKEGCIPLPDEVVKRLSDHCKKMMARSDEDARTAPFEEYINKVDYARDLKHLWIPEYLSPFFGTEFWNRSNDEQKLVLNQMGWVAHYQYSVIGEEMTLQYNNACAYIFRQNGHEKIADYLERESDEEVTHIRTFSAIGNALETRYLGRPMLKQRIAAAYTLNPNGFSGFNGWTATSFYYWLRGHQNIALRSRELAMQKVETQSLAPEITHAHFRDETRHYATSHLLAESMAEVEVALPAPVKLAFVCGRSFNGPQAGCNWIWPTVQVTPGILVREAYTLLSNPIFGLDVAERLDVLESVYTRRPENPEWEGMRMRSMRSAQHLNEKVPWLPESLHGDLEQTLRYNPDKSLPYARKAFRELKSELESGELRAPSA